ncbi:hypothetical protein CR513_34307, partial [Mucuna pruriens]
MYKAYSIAYTGLVKRGRIFKFLHGLNSEYNHILVQILGKENLPSLSESEKTQRSIMLDKGSSNTRLTMVTRKGKPFTKSSSGEYYTYCKRPGHTKDTYYKIYGKEKVFERMGGNKGPTQVWVNQTTFDKENVLEHPSTSQLDQDIQAFSKEEMDHLQALLNSTSKPLGLCALTMKNHITSFPSYFTSYLKVSKKKLIIVANGDHVPIIVSGNVQLQSSSSLHNVLHVLKLANNLISMHRLIQDWNCLVTSFCSHCVIQELTTGG